MRKRVSLILVCFAIVSGAFLFGKWYGGMKAGEKQMAEEMRNWKQFAEMDKAVLQTLPTRSNTMKSGPYLMQVWFPNLQLGTQEYVLKCENGQIRMPPSFSRSGIATTLALTGNVVSWTQEGAGYEANAKFVGLIDGDEMWGRVYGWNPGEQSVGFWRIYPKGKQNATTNQTPRIVP